MRITTGVVKLIRSGGPLTCAHAHTRFPHAKGDCRSQSESAATPSACLSDWAAPIAGNGFPLGTFYPQLHFTHFLLKKHVTRVSGISRALERTCYRMLRVLVLQLI